MILWSDIALQAAARIELNYEVVFPKLGFIIVLDYSRDVSVRWSDFGQ